MAKFTLPITKDGYITANQLIQIMEPLVEEICEAVNMLNSKIEKQADEIKRLNAELDTERRLRLGVRRK